MKFRKTAILGVGLMGGSFALAMRKGSLSETIVGYGRNESNLARAREKGIIDAFETDPARACQGADLVVLCTPVGRFASLAEEVRGSLGNGAIVIDLGSVKGGLVRRLEDIMPEGVHYVGCHPIAGSERSGADAADGSLYQRALCVITRTGRTDPEALGRVQELWRALGAETRTMDPDEHDKVYALVSHMPHLIAYALVNTVADLDGSFLDFAGQGFKDTTRIASSAPGMWRDICLMNRDNLLDLAGRFSDNLDRLCALLRAGDSEGIEAAFERARKLREKLEN
ncbi:MAG: prephenate dehydrogenase [Thermodesulfovibrionales bacterium]